ncbi:MAG: hypothetical protein ACR2PT_18675 [Endozoicomonas sp.]
MNIRLDRISARRAVHDAYAIQLRTSDPELRTVASSSRDISADAAWSGLQAGKIIAAIEAQPVHLGSWLVWAYGPRVSSFEMPAQARVFDWLSAVSQKEINESQRQYRVATQKKIRDVIAWTVMDYRHFQMTEEHLYPVSEIKKRCQIRHANWKRDFQLWFHWTWMLCEQLDQEGLAPLEDVLTEERRRLRTRS